MRDSGLAGRIAIVTGAGGGIGAAVVRALHAEGARVAALDIDGPAVERLARDVGASGAVMGLRVDVVDAQAVEAAISTVESAWGPIDLGVNVAGVLSTTLVVD